MAWNTATSAWVSGLLRTNELVIESTIADENLGFADYAEEHAVRLTDGGFVDNSAVAFQLRQMLETGDLTDGFEVAPS